MLSRIAKMFGQRFSIFRKPASAPPAFDREECIRIIENSFPADSTFDVTREIGEGLLKGARIIAGKQWRNESDQVLKEYAELCKLRLLIEENV